MKSPSPRNLRSFIALLACALALPGRAAAASPARASVTVAQDGTGDFRTVQQAVDAAPEGGVRLFVIRLKPGRYREKLLVPKTKGPLQLRGTDAAGVVLTFDDNADTLGPDGKKLGTVQSAAVAILAEDFSAENITFENSFGPGLQAVAVNVLSSRAVFRKCRFLGWQDTLFLKGGAQYFEDCRIEGSVDFIFGPAAAFFERCELHGRAAGTITAASTPENQTHGFVFSHCRITAAPDTPRMFLGRPWRGFANVVFLSTEMPASVPPEGWSDWNDDKEREKTARYAEHRSTGAGGGAAGRVPWSKQLSDAEASELTALRVLGWNPDGGVSAALVGALPAAEQEPWWQYLERSAAHRQNDKATLAAELKKANLEQPPRAPHGADFKLDAHTPANWYASDQAREIGEAVLSFQTPSGGWSKHVSFEKGPRTSGMAWTSDELPWHYAGTFDNHSTISEMELLARIYQATKREPCRLAFLKALDYVFGAQFPNGGWPQGYPLEGGYQDEVTFNDDAMIHVLDLLRDITTGQPEYAFVDGARRARAQDAMNRGVRCILRCQFAQNGRKTVWCAQHDPLTLAPAWARLKEPPSLSGGESCAIVRFLMDVPGPSAEIVAAVESALAWFERSKLTGIRIVNRDGHRSYEPDPTATDPCWARFYDLNTNRPMFAGGQDGIVYDSFAEMAKSNATSYDYVTSKPRDLLEKDQPKWHKALGRAPGLKP